ncbi:unnamed protein product [Rotaria sp. Silwood1]|nr:unnamed protein product [Rotaria sp. Silwood1]CAF1604042.1 unnamed protein product [Rotaria sp. Silwood1]CAF3739513.1 unnamed protein product [Rotaria sp. Silwood1]CAF3809481.1 unnamed protein product [Rotaria sp. Silwood1]CAF4610063.1 unnamed protein product [Rotaria sp. Silwood1]
MNKDNVSIWLNQFKSNWLPQTISNDTQLLQLITNKINELEQLLLQNNQIESESSIEVIYQSAISPDIQEFIPLIQEEQTSESCLLTSSDKHNHIDVDNGKRENICRPAIRLKRISLAEAELYLPIAWKTTKPKRSRKKKKRRLSKFSSNGRKTKKNAQTNKILLSETQPDEISNSSKHKQKSTRSKKFNEHPSTSSIASIQLNNDNKKKTKRKLRAIDAEDDDLYTLGNISQIDTLNDDTNCEQIPRYIGQNGILSQTRKLNDTSMNIVDDDITMKLSTKKSNKNKNKNSSNNTKTKETSICESLTIIEDVGLIHQQQNSKDMTENDHESLFDSLNITNDRTFDTSSTTINQSSIINYNDCIEDISNDGIDPPLPTLSSTNISHFLTT